MKIVKKFSAWIVPIDYVEFTSGQLPYQVIECVKLFDRISYNFKQGWFNLPKGISPDIKKTIREKISSCLTVNTGDCIIFIRNKKAYCRFENVIVTIEI